MLTIRCVALFLVTLIPAGSAFAQDPFAANNGIIPSQAEWSKSFRLANLDYPKKPVKSTFVPGADGGAITTANAEDYVLKVKTFLEPSLRGMIDDSDNWQPKEHGWWDLPWRGGADMLPDGTVDPTSGRDIILDSYTGQIIPNTTWGAAHRPSVPHVQNQALMYYNDVAAGMLGQVFRDVYKPDGSKVNFPAGSIVIKAEAVTPTEEEWPYVKGAGLWHAYRPSVDDLYNWKTGKGPKPSPQVLTLSAFQMSIAVKDPLASPQTGWVYISLVYDATSQGETPWDRFVPLGAQWGNDPEYAKFPDGRPPAGSEDRELKETWISKTAPRFAMDTLGWGGRLAGPMDVATRHTVVTTEGTWYTDQNPDPLKRHIRASSCLSCHGSAEFPFTTNLYPSPNKAFPMDDTSPFLLFEPGSEEWARWFQNRKGTRGGTSSGDDQTVHGLDYDMAIMFALNAFNAAMGNVGVTFKPFKIH